MGGIVVYRVMQTVNPILLAKLFFKIGCKRISRSRRNGSPHESLSLLDLSGMFRLSLTMEIQQCSNGGQL